MRPSSLGGGCQGVDVAACGAELQLQLIGRRDAAAVLHRVFKLKGFACSVECSRPSVCPTVSVGCCSV